MSLIKLKRDHVYYSASDQSLRYSGRMSETRISDPVRRSVGLVSQQPRLVIPAERDLFGPFFLRDDYLFAIDWQGHPTGLRQPALLYVDLRDALRTGQTPLEKNRLSEGFNRDHAGVSHRRG